MPLRPVARCKWKNRRNQWERASAPIAQERVHRSSKKKRGDMQRPCAGAHPAPSRLGLYRFRGSHLSHLVGAGMRGYDLPTIVKLLEVHGGITDYLLLGTWERDRPPGESQCEVWLK